MYPKNCYPCLRTPVTYVPGLYTPLGRKGNKKAGFPIGVGNDKKEKGKIAALYSDSLDPLAKAPLFPLSGDRYLVAWPRQDPPFDKLPASPKGYGGREDEPFDCTLRVRSGQAGLVLLQVYAEKVR
jgi:hypothetical protein